MARQGRAGESELRDWSDKSGQHHVRMTLLRLDGEKLLFRMADGRLAATSISRLSDADREYVAVHQAQVSPRANWLASERQFFSMPLMRIFLPNASRLARLQAAFCGAVLTTLQDSKLLVQSGSDAQRLLATPAKVVYVRISRNFLEDFVQRTVSQCESVSDCILGTRVVGAAKVTGKTRLVLQADENQAVADLEFVGRAISRTVGYNGPAIIHSAGETPFEARKRITMSESGLQMTPKPAHAQMFSRTLDIDSWLPGLRGRLVRMIASRRVAEKRPLAEEIGAQLTAARIGSYFDQEVRESVNEVRQTLESRIPALPYDHSVRHRVQFRSAPEYVEVELIRPNATAAEYELRPSAVVGNPDLAVRIHQSAITRAITAPETRQAIVSMLLELLQDREPQEGTTTFRNSLPASALRWSFNAGWLEIEFTDPKRQASAG